MKTKKKSEKVRVSCRTCKHEDKITLAPGKPATSIPCPVCNKHTLRRLKMVWE